MTCITTKKVSFYISVVWILHFGTVDSVLAPSTAVLTSEIEMKQTLGKSSQPLNIQHIHLTQ